MKNIFFVLTLIPVFFASCKKDKTPAPVTPADTYMSATPDNTWTYEVTNNVTPSTSSYTRTSTSRDSSINSKAYHVFTRSDGGPNEYYSLTGNDYYTFQNLPTDFGGSAVETIYLKSNAAINTSWTQTYTVSSSGVPLTVNLINTIAETGVSKTVNGIAYTDVIHVTTAITASVFGMPIPASGLTSDIQSYYAKKTGLIQSSYKINIDYSGIVSKTDQLTILKSSSIK